MRCRYCGAVITLNIECTVIIEVCDSCLLAVEKEDNKTLDRIENQEQLIINDHEEEK